MKKMLVFIVFLLLLFSNHNVWADPALPFVVNDGSIGKEYYAITGIDANSAIAGKSGGNSYVKANFAGSYNTGSIWSDYKTWFGLAFVVIVLMLLYNIFRNKK
ncbi:hypothetical protein KZ483_14015 [Paenibacillus sp. sptzw28]|uniref:hypothetical protein n=1 Tax=Paenibacillus sp. sptzw28 TaxID=715179 RepID=UPI001C6E023F|nr:hypothetical protein [Paenibacillus sp. sptzw28]QYR19092.1 hypothetical protein KZ483_14015 [Paenibacillus sp. sptzw28]